MAPAAAWSLSASVATARLRASVTGAWSGSENHCAEPTELSALDSDSRSPNRSASSIARPPTSIAPAMSRASMRLVASQV
jgi:hypothetical protein